MSKWFIIAGTPGECFVPVVIGEPGDEDDEPGEYNENIATFDTEDEAHKCARGNIFCNAKGYEVYEWE